MNIANVKNAPTVHAPGARSSDPPTTSTIIIVATAGSICTVIAGIPALTR